MAVSPDGRIGELEAVLSELDDQAAARVLRLIWEDGQEDDHEPDGLVPVADGLGAIIGGLGLPPLELLGQLFEAWSDVAGSQWASLASPIVVKHGELLVEAADRRIVRWLRHDAEPLVRRIEQRFGSGFVTRVRVVGPRGVARSW